MKAVLQTQISVELMQRLYDYKDQHDMTITSFVEEAIRTFLAINGVSYGTNRADDPSSIGQCMSCSVLGPRERGLCIDCIQKVDMVNSHQEQYQS